MIREVFPAPIDVDNSIPEKPKAFLEQANNSLHTPSGAIMLAASAVDAMLKEKSHIKGSLYNRIQEAVDAHLITAEMAT